MINLLPTDTKEAYRYARRNRILLRWASAIGASLIFAAMLVAGGYVYLNQQIKSNEKLVTATREQLEQQDLSKTEKEVAAISSNLRLAVQVLSKEILFSDLLKQLGSVTPSNAILTNLTIAQTQGGIDITARTTSYDAATQLQLNLEDPKNRIFSKADIIAITCASSASGDALASKYPCTANLRALFADDNPFLFINSGAKK